MSHRNQLYKFEKIALWWYFQDFCAILDDPKPLKNLKHIIGCIETFFMHYLNMSIQLLKIRVY